ncbi:MAG: hypothetical protein HWQ58_36160 [Nostoc sp. LPT]|nr:hypothetical protein [Nostoc sp. LPT]
MALEVVHQQQEQTQLDTPGAIAILLQADKRLELTIANALALLIKAAYP